MATGKTNSATAFSLRVRGGTAQPGGVEGLIWVKTDTPVSSWAVSQAQPKEPAPGMVWVKDGEKNGINIIRRNTIEVFPSSCMQYIGDAWKNMEAYLFRNGEWVQFSAERIYLIKDGKLAEGVSFVSTRKQWSSENPYTSDMSVTETANGVRFRTGQGSYGSYVASCKSPEYDFTGISRVCFSAATYKAQPVSDIVIGFGNPTYINQLNPILHIATGDNQSLDVSMITGTQFFTIAVYHADTYIDFTDLWLE